MKIESSETKKKIEEAAIELFTTKGYQGTAVRDIAKKAGVNVSLVSYYFGGKNGLLEELITSFYEGYLREIEIIYHTYEGLSVKKMLLEMIDNVLTYQQKQPLLSRFAHREMTLDSTLVREVMTTYLAKEKFIYDSIFEKGIKTKEFQKQPVMLLTMQLRDLLIMPFLHPLYISEVYYSTPHETYFIDKYRKTMRKWVEQFVCIPSKKTPFLSTVQTPLLATVHSKWSS
ncbi:forespore capture DNA-binding protein RefZ [Fictibacillus sp. Mic-4]|uniref:forespore capture DNA-binding protein RefZ n=1 Tax=Fictibacillus TaxID=1329200 RepID=UPI00040A38F6|nr:forespore capture DNA-binding protein RefZ [Fictibacillus gelatini]